VVMRTSMLYCVLCVILCGCRDVTGREAGQLRRPAHCRQVRSYVQSDAACFAAIRRSELSCGPRVEGGRLSWSWSGRAVAFTSVDSCGRRQLAVAELGHPAATSRRVPGQVVFSMGPQSQVFWCDKGRGWYAPGIKASPVAVFPLLGSVVGDARVAPSGTTVAYTSLRPDTRLVFADVRTHTSSPAPDITFLPGMIQWSPTGR
jgi:hypothetical protein